MLILTYDIIRTNESVKFRKLISKLTLDVLGQNEIFEQISDFILFLYLNNYQYYLSTINIW